MAVTVAAPPARVERTEVAAIRWEAALKLTPVLLQLGLAALVIQQFQLESRTFYHIFLLAVVAFPIHAVLPLRYRPLSFAALSLAGIAVAFGMRDGVMLVAMGLTLIAACHLPIRFGARVLVVLALGVVLALARSNVVQAPISAGVWPILGSMFMFRLALYLHALRHDRTRPTVAGTLSYFFMLPNACFPLFPIIDYSTFGRTYYDADSSAIYERGTKWIIRGLVQLLLYRLVYQHLTLDPDELADLGDLVLFMLSTFLLYLRVSGQFHLIVGMLHLFGYHLPETHRLYFLASSFTDFWRRINIYWKDFMMKLVYYPSFFRVRRFGNRPALVIATAVVFFATWVLHSYQWYWLRGDFLFSVPDALFWAMLGGVVIVNTLRESRPGRKRKLAGKDRGWDAGLAVRTVATFTTLCVLWSMWSSESFVGWIMTLSVAANANGSDLLLLAVLLAGGLLVAGRRWDERMSPATSARRPRLHPAVAGTAILAGLLIIAQPSVHSRAGVQVASVVASLQVPSLSSRDAALQNRGYYENLDEPGRLTSQLWEVIAQAPDDWAQPEILRERADDFVWQDYAPSQHLTVQGHLFTINRWGMRDEDYAQAKAAGTVRIALFGPSFVAGIGVADGESFEAVLENRLAQDPAGGRPRFEILNFAVSGHSLLQQLYMMESRGFAFEPDVVIITSNVEPEKWIRRHLMGVLSTGAPIAYPELQAFLAAAGIDDVNGSGTPVPFQNLRAALQSVGISTKMPFREARWRLRSQEDEMIAWSLDRIASGAREHGAVPVLLALNQLDSTEGDTTYIRVARQAGFVVLNLLDVYGDLPVEELRVAPWDNHPNARAHRLIADRLYEELWAHVGALGIGGQAAPNGVANAAPN